jgi:hypothetical protein
MGHAQTAPQMGKHLNFRLTPGATAEVRP